MRLRTSTLCVAAALATMSVFGLRAQPQRRPVTVDDLMRVRAIVDARIAPDGSQVAYVVSTPSLAKNEHEGALFVVAAGGGTPVRVGASTTIFNLPVPTPRLRWSPDSTMVAVLALRDGRPQVVAIPVDGGPPRPLTSAPEGVSAFEWSPDGKRLAYLTRDPLPEEEARQRRDRSFVVHADAPDRPVRLAVQELSASAPARVLSPAAHYVDALSWSPDGREIAYSAAPKSGFTAPYYTRIYAVSVDGGTPRTVVDRAGTNSGPRFSPDGRS